MDKSLGIVSSLELLCKDCNVSSSFMSSNQYIMKIILGFCMPSEVLANVEQLHKPFVQWWTTCHYQKAKKVAKESIEIVWRGSIVENKW